MRVSFFHGVIAVVLPLVIVAPSLCAQPTTDPSTKPARRVYETAASKLPVRQYASLHDVIRVSRDGDRLIVWSAANDLETGVRAEVPGMTGEISLQPLVTLQPMIDAQGTKEPQAFVFQHAETIAPDVDSIAGVTWGAGRLSIARDSGPDEMVLSVQLLQAPLADEPNPTDPNVRLYIRRGTEKILDAGALSFGQLYAKHPREVDEYVRPILRDLGSEAAVFAPEPRGAWQVFAESHKADSATIEKVNAALARLDADDFQTRERAATELQEIGQPAALVLMHLDRSKRSPEMQQNIDSFLAAYRPFSADDVNRLRNDRVFLLDCLSLDDATLRTLAWDRLKEVAKPTVEFDPNADAKTRGDAIAKLRQSLSR